jgi:hypothetical protein
MGIKILVFLFLLNMFFVLPANAQITDTLEVQMNTHQLQQGDTLNFGIELKNYLKVAKSATIQLWIEELNTGKKWHYRYPMINGYVNAFLTLDNELRDGFYAFNFLLQKSFFNLFGQVKNADKSDDILNYIILTKNMQSVTGTVNLSEAKSFQTGHLLFTDSA